jgi:S-(hydroxymethyl)mycothiol dehydrogenase
VEEVIVDPPGPGEVLVRVVASGVCHTDLHAKNGEFGGDFPYLLGHEATGVVEAVGEGVLRPVVGDMVVLSWRAPCGVCRFCTAGRPEMCPQPAVAGPRLRTRDGQPLGRVLGLGTFTTHTVVAAGQAIPVAKDLPPEATCLLGCAVGTGVGAALRSASMPPGATVAVYGCGAVGVSVIMGARLAHASRVIAVDINLPKLEAARMLGATEAVDASKHDPVRRIRELVPGGVDFAFDVVGIPETVGQALSSCGMNGTAVLVGVPTPGTRISYPMSKFFFMRQRLVATWYGESLPSRDIPLYAEWYRDGLLDLDALVTTRIRLEDVERAFASMQRGETLRSVIVMA